MTVAQAIGGVRRESRRVMEIEGKTQKCLKREVCSVGTLVKLADNPCQCGHEPVCQAFIFGLKEHSKSRSKQEIKRDWPTNK